MKISNLKVYLLVVLLMVIGFVIGRFSKPSNLPSVLPSNNQLTSLSDTEYTCSMHPQIRQNGPGKCPLCAMDLIPVSQNSMGGESSPYVYAMSPEAMALANIQTQKVKTVSPEHEIYLTGKVALNEQRLAVITANYSGRIEQLYVDFTGQSVTKGQKLASIYSPELVTAQRELIEASKFKAIHPALYNASKEKLRLWKLTESQINDIENREEVLTEFDVYADHSGIVIRRDISKGDFVSKGAVLFEIADLSNVWVFLDAYESDLPFMRLGQRIIFTFGAIPGREFTSNISFIDPLINSQTRTASIRAELNNPQQILKPEMFAKGKIKANLSVRGKALVIPKTSLLWTGKRSIVYVRIPDSEFPAFEMREIVLGNSLGDYYIVESGLKEGEEIVTNGVFAIDGAAQLSGNYSMMNRAVDKSIAVPDLFISQLSELTNLYFQLKNSLVKTDFQQSQLNAKNLESALNKMDRKLLDENALNVWLKHHAKLKNDLGQFLSFNDIEKQREVFSSISNQIILTVETFGLRTDNVYVAFCPMAMNDKGAYWLSEFQEIRNPYYGDKMMRCGIVKKTLSNVAYTNSKSNQKSGHQH
ncbi:MAG TPA: efflux RND transporter periplasmic adaptor subunit [Saprospiraceae bacterium]|nr:efflux RND transporter periplasmic adaptor subunit [Saprospiraceae bacterium]